MRRRLVNRWRRGWLRFSEMPVIDAMAKRLARLGLPPYTGCIPLANLHPRGYVSPDARIAHDGFVRGRHCFIGDGVLVYREEQGGEVRLGDHVHIHENNSLQTGQGGSIAIGSNTHIQPRCQFSGYKGSISIGARVEIAPACAFYPYNHGMAIGIPIQQQPIFSRSGIFIGDDAWLGYGVIVLDGAWIGNGAIIAAGAVVSGDIPENAIAAGVPARVIAARQ